MAECGSWSSIKRHGLRSTSALLDLFEIEGPERRRIESEWRRNSVPIQHRAHGDALIRDQGPMPPDDLEPLLDGLTPKEWYELINRKSFFWATEDRLSRFLNAVPYRHRIHDVITVDTRELLERHLECITLSSINSGVASFGPKYRRGVNTFRTIEDYPPNQDVAEFAVEYQIPDIADMIISVEQWKGPTFQQTVWKR